MATFTDEICDHCGLTLGSHHGGTQPWPMNYCPGHEGGMDWDKGPGSVFKPTGTYRFVPLGQETNSRWREETPCTHHEDQQ